MAEKKIEVETDESFNESELQDIMNEIESLEQEFEGFEEPVEEAVEQMIEEAAAEEVEDVACEAHEAHDENSDEEQCFDDQTLREVEQMIEDDEHEEEDHVGQSESCEVVAMKPSHKDAGSGQVEFFGSGDMTMTLKFKVGEKYAHISVEDKLYIELGDVKVCLSDDSCDVSMTNGVHFNVPLVGHKKAS